MAVAKLKKQFYLIVGATKKGTKLELTTPRIVVGRPNQTPKLKAGEIAILVTIELPETLFQRPTFTAKVVIPDDAAVGPVIAADVVNHIVEAVSAEYGFQLTIEQVPASGKKEDR